MKNNWPLKKMGEVANIIGGYAFKSTNLKNFRSTDDYLPIIKIGNLTAGGNLSLDNMQYHKFSKNLSKFLVDKNDILVAMTGATTGKVSVSDRNGFLLNQRVGVIRAKKEIADQNYLKYLLLAPSFYKYCQNTAGGGAQGNISPSKIIDFSLPFPNLSIQKQIVEKLDAIRKAQKLIDLQIRKTEELFESIAISAFKDGERHQLGNLFIRQTKTILPTSHPNDDFNFVGLENIESNTSELVNFKLCKGNDIKSNKTLFQKGHVLYGKLRPYLNKVWLAEFDGLCSTDIWVLQSNVVLIKPIVLATLLKSNLVVNRMSTVMTGTNLPRANASSFDSLEVRIPSIKEQQKIVKKLETLQKYKKILLKQKQLYKELFDSVLDKCMKGELVN